MASKDGKKENGKKAADDRAVDASVEENKADSKQAKEANKGQIAELKKKKQEMDEELDELKGNTAKGKIGAFFVFLLTLALCLGLLVGAIKLNVGNFASDIMAPLISDVPIVRNVLPTNLQKKSASEIASAAQAATEAQAATQAAAQAQAATEAQAASAAQAAADAAAKAQADSEAAAKAKAVADAAAKAQADSEAAVQDYVSTYSKMAPKSAAGVFDNMMPAKSAVVVKILTNMTPSKRAAILAAMNVNNASQLTAMMEK